MDHRSRGADSCPAELKLLRRPGTQRVCCEALLSTSHSIKRQLWIRGTGPVDENLMMDGSGLLLLLLSLRAALCEVEWTELNEAEVNLASSHLLTFISQM